MAIIVKKPEQMSHLGGLYSWGQHQTKLIVGLGNPGIKYEKNRHNLGFRCLDKFSHRKKLDWQIKKKFDGEISQITISDCQLLLFKPQTYVNRSGVAIEKILRFKKISPSSCYVVFDDIRLPFGSLEFTISPKNYGHGGLKSIHQQYPQVVFNLIRVGVGPVPSETDLSQFVLADFSQNEEEKLPIIIGEVSQWLEEIAFNLKPTRINLLIKNQIRDIK